MTAYVDLLTLMNQAQRDYAHLTDLIGRLQETPSYSYDFKASRQGFQVNMGIIRNDVGRGLGSTWTSGVGWDAGLSSQYEDECIIYRKFATPLVVNQFVLRWENRQGSLNIIVEGFHQGTRLFNPSRSFSSSDPASDEWTYTFSSAKTIDTIALLSSHVNPPKRITFTYFSLS
jgi:hypothetical protein